MRMLSTSSPLHLCGNEKSLVTFLTQSFYQRKTHRAVYVNPLERQTLRKYLQEIPVDKNQCKVNHNSVGAQQDLAQKENKKKKKSVKKPKKVVRENMPPLQERKTASKPKRNLSMKSPRKSLQIAKKGVRLYLQNWRNEQQRKRGGKSKSSKNSTQTRHRSGTRTTSGQLSASRSLKFGKSSKSQSEVKIAEVDVTEPSASGGLKRELDGTEEGQSTVEITLADISKQSPSGGEGEFLSTEEPSSIPARKRMKTGAESLNLADEEETSTLLKDERELEEYLWSPWEQSTSNLNQDTPDTLPQLKCASPISNASSSSPKLYPIFTPPVTPSRSCFTSLQSDAHTPKRTGGLSTPGGLHTPDTKSPASWQKLRDKDGMEQMVLDLGQKYFGAVTCGICGMVYTATHPEDEANHARFHRKYLSCTKFNGWKSEEMLEEYPDGRIIMIGPDAPKYAHKKVEEIRELVDRELGFVEGNSLSGKDRCKTFLFISTDKKIAGCLIAEGITKGYRVIPDREPKLSDAGSESKKAWCCAADPSPAVCGVSRIWVARTMRRKNIASRLMDALRYHYTFGSVLTMDDIAFSDPTPDGKLFATAFSKTPQFLVYKYT